MSTITDSPPLAAEVDAKAAQLGAIAEALETGRQVDADGYAVDPLEALCEAALSVEIVQAVRVLLCCGGPAVEAVAILDREGEVVEVRMIGAWAGERIERRLSPDDPAWRALQAYADAVVA